MQQRGKAPGTGHGQVQQHQLHLRVRLQHAAHGGSTGSFQRLVLRKTRMQNVKHRSTEQGVIVSDEQ